MKKQFFFLAVMALLVNGCVSYTHMMDAPQLTSLNKCLNTNYFVFKGTYSIGGFVNESAENFQKIDSSKIDFYETKPTYKNIINRVHKVFGKEATIANIVWDIKHVNVFGLKSQQFESVMFDVYVPALNK